MGAAPGALSRNVLLYRRYLQPRMEEDGINLRCPSLFPRGFSKTRRSLLDERR
jgi:hypothetical protein